METRHPQVYSEFGRAQFAKGRAEGRGEEGVMTLLAVLGARGMNVDDETRARITECTDLERLRRWVVRAANAVSLDEVFRDE